MCPESGIGYSVFERVDAGSREENASKQKALDQPQPLQAGMAVLADDNVIVHGDVERAGDLDDPLGHLDVGLRRGRIARRMIMDQPIQSEKVLFYSMLPYHRDEMVPVSGICNGRQIVVIPVQSGQYFRSPDSHAVARIPHGQAPPLGERRSQPGLTRALTDTMQAASTVNSRSTLPIQSTSILRFIEGCN